jgi:DNA-binding protein HU-beta
MNRRELIAAIAAHSDAEPKTVDAVLRGFTDVVSATVAKGDPVVLSGFAKFAKIQTKARMGRNPATGEAIKIKASKKARITPLKGFKDIVLGAAPAPKLTKPSPVKKAAPAKTASKTTARPAASRTAATRPTTAKRTTAAKAPAARTRATKTATTRRAPARSTTKR